MYKNNRIAAEIKRGLGVHQMFHSAREKMQPVTFRIVAKTTPTSAEAAARMSQPGLEVIR